MQKIADSICVEKKIIIKNKNHLKALYLNYPQRFPYEDVLKL